MRTLVMGDIHGSHRALVQCLERSGFNSESDRLIQLGDVTDRGPEVFDCVETLLQIKTLIAIKSNHDKWFLDYIHTGYHTENWAHGGRATVLSYEKQENSSMKTWSLNKRGYKRAFIPADIPASHVYFFTNQVSHYIDSQNNCFVHGGFNPDLSFAEQNENDFLYDRTLWNDAMLFAVLNENATNKFRLETPFHEVFIGHTPTTHWNTDQPMQAANIWNVDTGAGRSGRLTIMDVETKQFWQSDPVNELYQ